MCDVRIYKSISYVGNKEIFDNDIFRKVGVEVYSKLKYYYPDLYNYISQADIKIVPSNLDNDLILLNMDGKELKKYLVLLVYDENMAEIPLSIKRFPLHSTIFPGNQIKYQSVDTLYIIIILIIIALIIFLYLYIFGVIDEINNTNFTNDKPGYDIEINE